MSSGLLSFANPGWSLVDGSINASGGSPQNVSLLSGYVSRAPWSVSGVDYAVGITSGTTLSDPSLGGLPSGAVYNSSFSTRGPTVVVSSANVHLTGWDFSLHGGISLYISGANNCIVDNCKFAWLAATPNNNAPGDGLIHVDTSTNFTFKYNTCNGLGAQAYAQGIELIYYEGTGNFIFQYNFVENYPSGIVAVLGNNTALDYRYNFITNGANYPGEHLNALEWSCTGGTQTGVVNFNTVVQYPLGEPSGEVFQFYSNSNGSTLGNCSCSYNTIINSNSNTNTSVRQNSTSYTKGTVITVPGANLNYYMCYTAGTSNSSQPSAYSSTGSDTSITDGTATFQGDNYSMSYNIFGSTAYGGATTTFLGPASVSYNYFDLSGAFGGAFYPSSLIAGGWTATGNINMKTGSTVTPT